MLQRNDVRSIFKGAMSQVLTENTSPAGSGDHQAQK
jgi:hypothetical protein